MISGKLKRFKKLWAVKWFYIFKEFNLTIDYERRGYMHSVILENEYSGMKYDPRQLVIQFVQLLSGWNLLDDYGQQDNSKFPEISLLAEVFENINILIDDELIALNKIFVKPAQELKNLIKLYTDNQISSLSEDDKIVVQDIVENRDKYHAWLLDAKENKKGIPVNLLGKYNLERKIEVLFFSTQDTGQGATHATAS